MDSLGKLVKRIEKIEERNKRVESDKAWETSWTRRFFLLIFTFASIGAYLNAIGVKDPWLNAAVPTIAFMLSTLTLPSIKDIWSKTK
ncbi:MAG: hypothetical protein KKD39_02775 [Candidatus Altiarchaeota archaeon]|nr:hypothetical protein [Candidatus Altiarchaeota archaeon]